MRGVDRPVSWRLGNLISCWAIYVCLGRDRFLFTSVQLLGGLFWPVSGIRGRFSMFAHEITFRGVEDELSAWR